MAASNTDEDITSEAELDTFEICKLEERLNTQLTEYKTILHTVQDANPPTSDDPEKLLESITQLQQELQDVATTQSIKELLLRRLQLGQTLIKVLFPPHGDDGLDGVADKNTREDIMSLLEKQTQMSTSILKVHKEVHELKEDLDQNKIQNLEMKKANRQLLDEIEQLKKGHKRHCDEAEQSERVQRYQESLDQAISKITLVKHVFQGLVLGSGINWAQDPELTELVLSLGQPVESHM